MMFDTLNIEVSKRVCGEPLGVSRYIDVEKSGRYERNGGAYIVGRLDNYRVYADEKRVRLSGSVAKLVQGENVSSPSREQVQEGVLRLSDALHINVGAGNVSRVDVASTLSVENEPAVYIGQLVSLRNAKRAEVGTGALYFAESGGMLCFYDKRAEITARNGTMPSAWAGFPNLLRYEMRCNGNIRGRVGTCRVDEQHVKPYQAEEGKKDQHGIGKCSSCMYSICLLISFALAHCNSLLTYSHLLRKP